MIRSRIVQLGIIAAAVVFVIIAFAGTALIREGIKYKSALKEAKRSFLASRGGTDPDPSSMKFILRGLGHGMNVSQVDELFRGATRKSLAIDTSDPQSHRARLYTFEYGSQFHDRFTGKSEYLFSEDFYVYFDDEWKANRVLYDRIGRNYLLPKTLEIDLSAVELNKTE